MLNLHDVAAFRQKSQFFRSASGRSYVPDTGDVVWLGFDPQAGHEQAGHQPALVLSPALYNGMAGLMVCCPLSSQVKSYPFEVAALVDGNDGVVLSDQVKSMDRKVRCAKKKGTVPDAVVAEVRAKIKAFLLIK